jgi:beta-lactamase class A
MDMVNSEWPIGTVGVRTMAAPAQVNGITAAMGNLWWDRPITVSGISIGAGSANLHVLTPYGAAQDIELRTNDAGMVDRFAVTMRPPVINKWADIDAELSKSGARYSYQVSRVIPEGPAGKCSTVAGTNTDLSLPLASIFKLYVLLAVADAVKAGTVSWNDSLTITEQAKAVGSAGLEELQHGHRSVDRATWPRRRRARAGGGRASRSGQHDSVPDDARAVLGGLG